MKQRFSSLDVRVISHELNHELAGARVTNVYDLVPPSAAGSSSSSASRSILLRFSRGPEKYQLVVDSGFRCHLTAYDARAAAAGITGGSSTGGGAGSAPSAFVSRLRKFLNGRVVAAVTHAGVADRVVEVRFGWGGGGGGGGDSNSNNDGNDSENVNNARQLRLYLEFFAAGNVVLTNTDASQVLALQRTVAAFRSASLDVTLSVGSPYAIGMRRLAQQKGGDGDQEDLVPLTVESVRSILEKAVAAPAGPAGPPGAGDATATATAPTEEAPPRAASGFKKKKKKQQQSVSRVLSVTLRDLSQVLIEHALQSAGVGALARAAPADLLTAPVADGSGDTAAQAADKQQKLEALAGALQAARRLADGLTTAGPKCRSYIVAVKKEGEGGASVTAAAVAAAEAASSATDAKADLDYVDFQPFRPRQFEADTDHYVLLAQPSLNAAADEFYSHLQGLKASRQVHHRETVASRKLEATRRDQAQRIESLEATQRSNERKAAALEAHQAWVQAALDAVNEQLRAGTDWDDLAQLIGNSADRNPVAALIRLPMRLAEQTITLRLPEVGDDNEEEEEDQADQDSGYGDDSDSDSDGDGHGHGHGHGHDAARKKPKKPKTPTIDVDVQLGLSAGANARAYYGQKREAAVKKQRTEEVAALALRNAERRVAEELRRQEKRSAVSGASGGQPQRLRRPQWFEKFLWFVSSDGYLVLGARDPQQCELLYRRHLRRGDVFVHAAIRGAPGLLVIKTRKRVGTRGRDTSAPDTVAAGGVEAPDTGDTPVPPATLAQAGCLAVCASEAWDTKAGLGAYWVRAEQVFKTTAQGDLLPPGAFDVRGEKHHLPPPQRVLGFGLLFRLRRAGEGEGEEPEEPEEPVVEEPVPTEAEAPKATEPEPEAEAEAPPDENDVKDDVPEAIAAPEAVAAPDKGKGKALRSPSPTPSRATSTAVGSGTAGGKKRGQRGKAKKLAKYKDQDEEDRVRAEQLIGTAAGREKKEAQMQAKAAREAAVAAADARRRAQRAKQAQAMRAYEAARQASAATAGGDEDGDDADGAEDLSVLDALVGRAAPGDTIAEVVPMCGPWAALAAGSAWRVPKYKVKMQPGATKKGKAMREVLERWRRAGGGGGRGGGETKAVDETSQDPERMWPRELELIAGIKMEEAANCLPVGKVTVMQAGGVGGGGAGGGGKGKGGGGKGGKKK